MFAIKVTHASDTRRLSFAKVPPCGLLRQMLANMFSDVSEDAPLRYYDDENDIVSIDSDEELAEAHRLLVTPTSNTLRLYLGALPSQPPSTPTPAPVPVPSSVAPPLPSTPAPAPAPLSAATPPLAEAQQPLLAADQEPPQGLTDKFVAQAEAARDSVKSKLSEMEILAEITSELEKVSLMISEKYEEAEVEERFRTLSRKLDDQINAVSSSASDQLQTVKTFIDTHKGISIVQQLETLRAQIVVLSTKLQQNFIAPVMQSVQAAVQKQISLSYPTFPAAPAATPTPLPVDTAKKDLERLSAMGFTDRERNIKLLLKNKGDVVLVVEELLK
eukprot:TRINITY_DN3560_c0_g1_i2.p1 TRINITY_DN3560_c0_g1~~TRINITY_DN3560_c0_g1_i2.p1  ORF type:complete len:353 (-),score=131.93 TRINITY_DN3560_c0_g1_i2:158-1150(-)